MTQPTGDDNNDHPRTTEEPMKSADRTRSKRWRSGTRRTKRHSAHTTIQCASPTYCLVHAIVAHPKRPPAMAMRLTRCEQKWVDDVTANRPHTHIKLRRSAVRRSNSIDLLGLIYRSNPGKLIGHEVKAMGGLAPGKHAVRQRPDGTVTITPYGDSKMGHSYHVPPGGVTVGMDISDRWYPRDTGPIMEMGTATYGRMR